MHSAALKQPPCPRPQNRPWLRPSRTALLLCLWACGPAPGAYGGRIAFLVAEYPGAEVHHDGYVVTIDDQDAQRLAQARKLAAWIAGGASLDDAPDGRIVIADVAAGADGINRNVPAPGQPLWSWHTTGEVSFADMSIEILDGWPTFVEEDVPGWMANTGGAVGFWSYTIVRELGAIPEPQSAALGGAVLTALGLRRRDPIQ
jgi:hypothetical protein